MSLVELDRFGSSVEADVRRLLLESYGISAVLFDAGLNNAVGGGPIFAVRLMVLDEDVEEARKILAEN